MSVGNCQIACWTMWCAPLFRYYVHLFFRYPIVHVDSHAILHVQLGPSFPCPSQKEKSWTSRRQSKGPASPIDAHSSLAELRVYRGDSGWGLSLPLGGNFLRVELRGSSVGWQPPSIDRCPNQPFFATLEPSTVKNRPPSPIQLEWWKRWFTVPRRASRKDWALVKR